MSKEIHFYEDTDYIHTDNYYKSWNGTREAYRSNEKVIHTTQMGFLDTCLFELGYRVFIHDDIDSSYEIKLGTDNERTERDIRPAHNLFKMWLNGEFNK